MSFITREEYIQRTLALADNSSSEGFRAKYWELAGKALGYLEPPKIEGNNIAIFQSISGEMMAFIKSRSKELSKEVYEHIEG